MSNCENEEEVAEIKEEYIAKVEENSSNKMQVRVGKKPRVELHGEFWKLDPQILMGR